MKTSEHPLAVQNREILSMDMYSKKYSQCDKEQKAAIKAELNLGQYSTRFSKLFKESKLSTQAFN